jgi:hypothetical protein
MLSMHRIGAVIVTLIVMSLSACTTTLVEPANVAEPATVFVLDHGRTPGLVLPTDDGQMAKYVYGDWNWYALGKTDFFTGLAALLWPTQGALGRAMMPGPPTLEQVQQHMGNRVTQVYAITVERSRVRALQARLDAMFEQSPDQAVDRPNSDLKFVPHPQKYTYFSNSNGMVAKWLEELGVEARGITLASKWRVESAAQSTDESPQEDNR